MESLLNLVESQPWFGVVAAVISLASAIAAVTPTPKEGTALAKIYMIIDVLALNIGKAKDTGRDDEQEPVTAVTDEQEPVTDEGESS
tara:strand:+ start:1084 stop:1344 length:261 start_codon:yes stop_codon:yes gene_type:complete